MADLFDRLFPSNGSENIPVHAFMAAVTDYIAGETTKAEIVAAWGLDSEAQDDLTDLCDLIDGLSTKMEKVAFALEFDAVMLLAAHDLKYTTKSAFKTRLGIGS